jgi:hypothetical protein
MPVGNRGFTTQQRTLTADEPPVFRLAALADESALGLDTAKGRAERQILAYDFASVPRGAGALCGIAMAARRDLAGWEHAPHRSWPHS